MSCSRSLGPGSVLFVAAAALLASCSTAVPANSPAQSPVGADVNEQAANGENSPSAPAVQSAWWDEPYPEAFDAAQLKVALSTIAVDGNHFVDQSGKTIVFRGVNISDPDKLEQMGQFKPELFKEIKAWGANLVRIPVHPTAWNRRGVEEYFKLLDQVVRWANEQSMYVVIDWHSMGNLRDEMYQHQMYSTTLSETMEFWRAIAFRYKGLSTVAFYELFNEPTVRGGTLGKISWEQWKSINEDLIDVIYAHDERVIPLVAGFNWAYDLQPIAKAPIERKGIGYVAHPYPQKTGAPFAENWDKVWGFAAEKYPLVITEMGYMGENDPGAHRPAIDDGSYGPRITDYLAAKGASWTAWCFDPDWAPQLIKDWNYTPTKAGEHYRRAMQQNSSEN